MKLRKKRAARPFDRSRWAKFSGLARARTAGENRSIAVELALLSLRAHSFYLTRALDAKSLRGPGEEARSAGC